MAEIIKNNLTKIIVGTLAVIILLIIAGFILNTKKPTAKVNNHTFSLYVAKESKDMQIGLSKYKSLPNNRGMIFVFDKPDYYPFWMKGMQFPIDIIYIKNGMVVTVFQNVKKEDSDSTVYYPTEPADKVLEINAGLSTKYGIKKGTKVETENL